MHGTHFKNSMEAWRGMKMMKMMNMLNMKKEMITKGFEINSYLEFCEVGSIWHSVFRHFLLQRLLFKARKDKFVTEDV